MLVPYGEHHIAARPIAHPPRKIHTQIPWALTLAPGQLVAAHRRRGWGGGLVATTLPIPTILLASLFATGRAGPVTPTRLHPTPTLRSATALGIAITDLRICRREPPFTALQQTTTNSIPR